MVCTEHTNVTWDTHAVATASCASSPDEPGLHDTYSSAPPEPVKPASARLLCHQGAGLLGRTAEAPSHAW